MTTNARLDVRFDDRSTLVFCIETGEWVIGRGDSFPATANGFRPPPDGASFWRTDLAAQYTWSEANQAWELVGAGGAPTDAEYLTGAAHAGLSAERVVTDTATVTWDLTVAGQAKANAVAAPSPDQDARIFGLLALLGF